MATGPNRNTNSRYDYNPAPADEGVGAGRLTAFVPTTPAKTAPVVPPQASVPTPQGSAQTPQPQTAPAPITPAAALSPQALQALQSPFISASSDPDRVDPPVPGPVDLQNEDMNDHSHRELEGPFTIVAFGEAQYPNEQNPTMSFYITGRDRQGRERTFWGVELKEALKKSGLEMNQEMAIGSPGDREVAVRVPAVDANGKVIPGKFDSKSARRKQWIIEPFSGSPLATLKEGVGAEAIEADNAPAHQANNDAPKAMPTHAAGAKEAESAAAKTDPKNLKGRRAADNLEQHSAQPPQTPPPPPPGPPGPPQAGAAQPPAAAPQYSVSGVAAVSALTSGVWNVVKGGTKMTGDALHATGSAMGSMVRRKPAAPKARPLSLASRIEPQLDASSDARPPVALPTLSTYRVDQLENAAQSYQQHSEQFWESSESLQKVRVQMQATASAHQMSMEQVAQAMKPGGGLEDLGQEFDQAVESSPAAQEHRKAMNKSLDSYLRHYERSQTEMLNPEQQGTNIYEQQKARAHDIHEAMEKEAAKMPGFKNAQGEQEPTHLEKIQNAVRQIAERLTQIIKDLINAIRGKSAQAESAATP